MASSAVVDTPVADNAVDDVDDEADERDKDDAVPQVEDEEADLPPITTISPAERVVALSILRLDRNSEQIPASLYIPAPGKQRPNDGVKERVVQELEKVIIESLSFPDYEERATHMSEYRKGEGFFVTSG
jgi:hypothetical protein